MATLATGDRFARISRIPLEVQATGRSMLDVVRASGYAELRGEFSPRELADYLRQYPELVEAWANYSEDKRTSEGWYFRRPVAVGRITAEPPPMREMRYPDPAAACAAFIVAELNSVLDLDHAV